MVCSRCGRESHTAKDCYAKTHVWDSPKKSVGGTRKRQAPETKCWRCGRTSHLARDCFATTSASGGVLLDDDSDSDDDGDSYSYESTGSISDGADRSTVKRGGSQAWRRGVKRAWPAENDAQTIYRLDFDDGTHYVGKTSNFSTRVQDHKDGSGAVWTRGKRIVKAVPIRQGVPSKDASAIESSETLELMRQYGVDNVRGGQWTQMTLSDEARSEIVSQIKHNNDLCKRCGREGHFAANCYAKRDVVSGDFLGEDKGKKKKKKK